MFVNKRIQEQFWSSAGTDLRESPTKAAPMDFQFQCFATRHQSVHVFPLLEYGVMRFSESKEPFIHVNVHVYGRSRQCQCETGTLFRTDEFMLLCKFKFFAFFQKRDVTKLHFFVFPRE